MTISNCGHDENNKYNGGNAGDQTGREWCLRSWYNAKWDVVIRHPDINVRNLIADMAVKAANNDKIGYNQGKRLTFWKHLKLSGYDPSKITVACEADCSSGVGAIVKGAGYRLSNVRLQSVSENITTRSERAALQSAGFLLLSDSKYLTSDKYLLAGDILLKEGNHTVINVNNGSMVNCSNVKTPQKLIIDGVWGKATTRCVQSAFGIKVDGIVSGQGSSMININNGGLSLRSWKLGKCGSTTIRILQKKIGVSVDGYFGAKTCAALQKYLGTYVDSCVDNPSDMVRELQRRLNTGTF